LKEDGVTGTTPRLFYLAATSGSMAFRGDHCLMEEKGSSADRRRWFWIGQRM
jgi:hypothetical protein